MSEQRDISYLVVDHLTTKVIKRVFAKIQIDSVTGCWNWTAALDPKYGLVYYRGRHEKIHRLLYAWLVGPLPQGYEGRRLAQLDHAVCQNTRCCNPVHLELVPQRVNTLRGGSPPALNTRKATCPRGHVYDAFWGKEGKGRYCKTCDRQRRRNEDPATRERRRENCARNHIKRMSGPRREEYMKRNREQQARYRAERKATLNG